MYIEQWILWEFRLVNWPRNIIIEYKEAYWILEDFYDYEEIKILWNIYNTIYSNVILRFIFLILAWKR